MTIIIHQERRLFTEDHLARWHVQKPCLRKADIFEAYCNRYFNSTKARHVAAKNAMIDRMRTFFYPYGNGNGNGHGNKY